jgi:hypothetical protein
MRGQRQHGSPQAQSESVYSWPRNQSVVAGIDTRACTSLPEQDVR